MKFLHSVLVNIEKTGVLFIGPSGSGKSTLAHDCVKNGHSLISDDIVKCYVINNILYGCLHNKAYSGLIYIPAKGCMLDINKYHANATKNKSIIHLAIRMNDFTHNQIPFMNILGIKIPVYSIRYRNVYTVYSIINKFIALKLS